MRPACKKDKTLVVHILVSAFEKTHGISWMFRFGKNRILQLKRLITFAFYKSLYSNGAYISSNEKGVALCFKYNFKFRSLIPVYHQIIFVLTTVRLRAIPKLMKLEKYKKQQRPCSGEYLYFWFFGVEKGGEDAGFELKNAMFDKAVEMKLSLYAETSIKRNKVVYERYGFETYHVYEDEKENLKFWFMKWDPEKNIKQDSSS